MKKPFEDFLDLVKKECKENKIKCDLRNVSYLKEGNIKCSGWFDSEKKVLAVAMKNSESKMILAHEYCHMKQWQEGYKLWDAAGESLDIIDRWLDGKDFQNIKKHIGIARDLELDNEIRTSKLIKKYDLGITPSLYIKKSNAYVLFYNWMLVSRRWSRPKNAPYKNERILKAMSPRFDMNYKTLDPAIKKIFLEESI